MRCHAPAAAAGVLLKALNTSVISEVGRAHAGLGERASGAVELFEPEWILMNFAAEGAGAGRAAGLLVLQAEAAVGRASDKRQRSVGGASEERRGRVLTRLLEAF